MKLIAERLDVIVHRQVFLKGFDVIDVLVSGWEHDDGDLDMLAVLGVDHGGMDFCCDGEGGSFFGYQRYNLYMTQSPRY